MGLFSFLKEKFTKKDSSTNTYNQGLEKSRKNFSARLNKLSKSYKKVNEEYFDELEELLLESDVGVTLTFKVIEDVLEISKKEHITDADKINEILVERLFSGYMEKGEISNDISFEDKPVCLLVVGVNGVGKTTTIAKLAKRYIDQGKKVLFGASDTFRAGAKEQLCVWGERLGIDVVTGPDGGDPASVAYDAAKKAKFEKYDLVIIDTAGRLQNKSNLMDELAKIKRVISKEIPNGPQETFLVIDATTGQNGVSQAKAFAEVTNLTGVVITKMDGTSKGGIILAIRDQIGVPVRFVGLGEKMDDLMEFDIHKYLYALCIGESDD